MDPREEITTQQMIDRFVFLERGSMVADTDRAHNDPVKLSDFNNSHHGLVDCDPEGDTKPVARTKRWLESRSRMTVSGLTFRPDLGKGIVIEDGIRKLNTWHVPWILDPKGDWRELYYAFMRQVFPIALELDYVEQLLGHMVQFPGERPQIAVLRVIKITPAPARCRLLSYAYEVKCMRVLTRVVKCQEEQNQANAVAVKASIPRTNPRSLL